MKPRPLTAAQQRVLTIVRERIEAGAAPTLRELAAELGITVRGAGGLLADALEASAT